MYQGYPRRLILPSGLLAGSARSRSLLLLGSPHSESSSGVGGSAVSCSCVDGGCRPEFGAIEREGSFWRRRRTSPARLSGTHWQHAQQILLPCWFLFRRFEALRRVLVLGESVGLTSSHPWTAYVVEVMGVTVVDSLPADDPCPVVGRLGQGRASFSPFSRGSCELSRVCKAPAPPRREVPLTRVGHQDHLAVEFSRKGGSRFLL